MKIAFLDLSGMSFDPLTPERMPLGGMQSGVCYLARELVRQGHRVSLFNGHAGDAVVEGVAVHNYAQRFAALQQGHDVFVSISCSGRSIRPLIGDSPLILYTGHNKFEPSLQALGDADERRCWDHFVFKSSWQAETLQQSFTLDGGRISIISNAVAPAFEGLGERQSFFFLEDRPPVLYYSSTPFRGLGVLAHAFPAIARACPGVRARVYSSLAPYHGLVDEAPHEGAYELCRRAGMDYVGSLSQPELAKAVRAADILAFPSTYPETSCVTVMEAMASASLIVSRALGAIPETSAGYARLLTRPEAGDAASLPERFAGLVVDAISAARRAPRQTAQLLQAERQYCLTNYSWSAKAREWRALLQQTVARTGSGGRVTDAAGPHVFHHVQTQSGDKLYVDPQDWRAKRLIQCGGNFNPAARALWRAALGLRQWTLIADVGANYGEMLFEAGVKRCERVLAFEPNPRVLPYLAKTLSAAPNVRIVPAALSDHVGEAGFTIAADWSGRSRLGDGPNQATVSVTTLDSVLSGAADDGPLRLLMKLDVEGHEIAVLRGAARSIAAAVEFGCLIEVSHLSPADAAWLAETFSIHALALRRGQVLRIDSLDALAEHGQFWHEDVLLLRRTNRATAE